MPELCKEGGRKDMTELEHRILDIVAIWSQGGYRDHEAMMMIYNLIVGGDE